MPILNLFRRRPAPVETEVRKRRVGLVLSGGAVRGAAHLGVLQVFDEEGIRPDLIVGVSAGSVVGGLYSAGMSPTELQKVARGMHWNQLGRLVRPRLGFFDISRMETFLNELTGDITFEQLEIPFAAVAVDILTNQLVVFQEGPLSRGIRASCSLPIIFKPLEEDNQLLVDGGALNNLPVGVARNMGADYVIAVDLLPPPVESLERPHNMFEMWSLAIYTIMRARYLEAQTADVLIQPDIAHTSYIDFSQTDFLAQKGREAARAHIARIKSDLEMTTKEG